MQKSILKKVMVESLDFVQKRKLTPRNTELEKVANYVFCGIRRCGKSFLLYNEVQKILKRKENGVVFLNFEDERFLEFKVNHFDLIIESAIELYGECNYLFFDEIQNIEGWEKFVRRLADTGYRVFVSGSNAKMLSKEIATTLGGRFMIREVFPLSFKEYLQFQNIFPQKHFEFSEQRFQIKELFSRFFSYGGFPELFSFNNEKEYLSNIYMKVFYGDIIARNHIQNEQILKLLIKKLAESVNNETSLNRIKNLVKSTGVKVGSNTIPDYLQYLFDAYLIFPLKNFASTFSERESKKKYYFIDQGVLNLFLFDQDSKLLENIVFLHLFRQFGEDLYYFKRKYEVNFYVPSESLLIQVSYSLHDVETRERELKALQTVKAELNAENTMIISFDQEDEIETKQGTVPVIPVWKWLLK